MTMTTRRNSKNKIILKKATHSNFMSYGNNVNEFTFPQGLNWLSASNGCGKSTEVEVLNFAFFGKSYRGGNRNELRNTMNTEATLKVTVEFDRVQGDIQEEYFLTRTLDPKGNMKFTLEKKEGDKWVVQNKRAGFTQKDFEENILHFNEILFKNNIAMNTQESIPFIDQEPVDRRKLTDSLIMMDNDRLKKENAKELSNAKTNYEIASNDIERINNEITNLNGIIAKMQEEKKANISQMEATLTEKKNAVGALQEQATQLYNNVQARQGKLAQLKAVIDTEPNIDRALAGISNAKAQVTALQQYRVDLDAANAELTEANKNYSALPIQTKNDELAAMDGQISQMNTDLNGIVSEISSLNTERGKADGAVQSLAYNIQQTTVQLNKFADAGKQRKNDLAHVDEQINLGAMMQAGTKCPTCGHTLTEDDIEAHKNEIRQKLIDDINADITRLRESWINTKNALTDLEKSQKDAEAAVAEIDNRLAEAFTRQAALKQKIDTTTASRGALFNEIQGFTAIYNTTVVPAKAKVDQLNRNIASAEAAIAATGIDVDKFVAEETRLGAEKSKIAEVRTQWQAEYNEYSVENANYSGLMGQIQQANGEIVNMEAEITRIKNATSADALAMTEKRLEEAKGELESATSRWHEASKTITACNYITGMLSDGGIKKLVYSLYIDHFNEAVRKNLLRANLPFVIKFDETMDFTFISSPGYAPSYKMLSQGQRRKVGFAIAMAFRDFVSLIGNFDINFMSLDEVLDISTDNYAMREMLDIVRSMVDDIGCVVVITHRGEVVADKFDHKITVEYDGTYSHMGDVVAV